VHAIASLAQEVASHARGPAKSGLDPLLELAISGAGDMISGGGEARGHATRALDLLALGGDRSALAALASSDAAIAWFVSRLTRGARDLAGEAAHLEAGDAHLAALTSLAEIGTQPEAPRAIVAAGGVPALIACAGRGDGAGERRSSAGGAGERRSSAGGAPAGAASAPGAASARAAACVLAQLAAPPHTDAVAEGGGTPLLLAALRGGGADAPLTLAAVGALRHLVGTPAGSAALTGAGVEPLVRLLQPGTPEDAQAHAG